jgi:hypothetical protein
MPPKLAVVEPGLADLRDDTLGKTDGSAAAAVVAWIELLVHVPVSRVDIFSIIVGHRTREKPELHSERILCLSTDRRTRESLGKFIMDAAVQHPPSGLSSDPVHCLTERVRALRFPVVVVVEKAAPDFRAVAPDQIATSR